MGITYVVNLPDNFNVDDIDIKKVASKHFAYDIDEEKTKNELRKILKFLQREGEVYEDEIDSDAYDIMGNYLRDNGHTVAVLDVHYEGVIILQEKCQ
jgi:hypothetical protein